MKLRTTDLHELTRLFIVTFGGRRYIAPTVMTCESTLPLSKLWGLSRRGFILYEEVPHFEKNFGVTAWGVLLSPAGRELLQPTSIRPVPRIIRQANT